MLRTIFPATVIVAIASGSAHAAAHCGATGKPPDLNRRLDREEPDVLPTDMWDVINGASTADDADDVGLAHVPEDTEFKCWPKRPPDQRFAIDFFVLDERAQDIADGNSYWKWRYQADIDANTPISKGPSDHCPSS